MRSDPHRASCSLEQTSRRPTTVVLPSSAGRRRPASYRGVVTSEVQVTEVPWLDPAAVALRRAMYEELAALYPDETAAVEAGGGFPVRDARAGRDVLLALVATLDGAPVGCAAVRRRPDLRDPLADLGGERQDATGDVGELRSVFVRPEARGRGVGRALLDRAGARAHPRSRGVRPQDGRAPGGGAPALPGGRVARRAAVRPAHRRPDVGVPGAPPDVTRAPSGQGADGPPTPGGSVRGGSTGAGWSLAASSTSVASVPRYSWMTFGSCMSSRPGPE